MKMAGMVEAATEVYVEIADPAWSGAGLGDLEGRVVACARAALAAAPRGTIPADRPAEIAVLLCDDARMARLNGAFRDKSGPTDVLSFPAGDEPRPEDPTIPVLLGDLAIAFGVSEREARAAGIPLGDHLSHLVVHGILHLLGFDHGTEAEAARMETLEIRVLAGLDVPDPYARLPAIPAPDAVKG